MSMPYGTEALSNPSQVQVLLIDPGEPDYSATVPGWPPHRGLVGRMAHQQTPPRPSPASMSKHDASHPARRSSNQSCYGESGTEAYGSSAP